jgi:hypothetical protein
MAVHLKSIDNFSTSGYYKKHTGMDKQMRFSTSSRYYAYFYFYGFGHPDANGGA